jgi:osmotically-inducible protein OsmY
MSTDGDIRGAVYQALTSDPRIDANDIDVQMEMNQILLNGTVPSQEQVSEATQTASQVPGVGQVHNLLAVAMPSQDYGDDAALTADADEALTANPAVPPGVKASAREGNITLTGTVSTTAQRNAAEDTAGGVGGVLSITNEIVIAGPELSSGG